MDAPAKIVVKRREGGNIIKISTTTTLFSALPDGSHLPIAAAAEACAAAGFEALDLSLTRRGLFDGDWKREVADAVEAAQKHNLKFLYAHVPYSYPAEDTPEAWAAFNRSVLLAIEACAFAGVGWAAIHPHSFAVADFDQEAALRHSMEHLSPFVDKAVSLGVGLAVENMRGPRAGAATHRYCSTAEELCGLVDALGGPVGICWDTGHANIAGLAQREALGTVGRRLKMLHVNDNYGADDEHIAPHTGTVDWAGVMAGLRDIGFSGTLNYEVGARRIPLSLRTEFAAYLLRAGQLLTAR